MNKLTPSNPLQLVNRRVLLGISGGIAAYKTVDLARKLTQAGAEVRCVLTEGATHFVSATALQAVTKSPVRMSLWDESAEAAMSHIELARWADTLLIAPATADVMARLAQGMANDLLTTLALATQAQLCLAPAMNGDMWRHAATQTNLALLQQRGAQVLMPENGSLACGEVDTGRMPESTTIVDWLGHLAIPPLWQGKKILITAGPTIEDIDPVRYLSNRSSGKMGYALAQTAVAMGADVCLISGPTQLTPPTGVKFIAVRSALEMFDAVKCHFAGSDLMLAVAAVADYRVEQIARQKIKKAGESSLTLSLVQNPDIVAWAAEQPNRGKVIAFAAETEHLIAHAQAKLCRKKVDGIFANSVAEGAGFDQTQNQLFLVTTDGVHEFALAHKTQLAQQVLTHLALT